MDSLFQHERLKVNLPPNSSYFSFGGSKVLRSPWLDFED